MRVLHNNVTIRSMEELDALDVVDSWQGNGDGCSCHLREYSEGDGIEAFRRLLNWLIPDEHDKFDVKTIASRALAMAWVINAEIINGHSLVDIQRMTKGRLKHGTLTNQARAFARAFKFRRVVMKQRDYHASNGKHRSHGGVSPRG